MSPFTMPVPTPATLPLPEKWNTHTHTTMVLFSQGMVSFTQFTLETWEVYPVPFSQLVPRKSVINSFYIFSSHFLHPHCHHPIPLHHHFPAFSLVRVPLQPSCPLPCAVHSLCSQSEWFFSNMLSHLKPFRDSTLITTRIKSSNLNVAYSGLQIRPCLPHQPVTVLFQFLELNTISSALKYASPSAYVTPITPCALVPSQLPFILQASVIYHFPDSSGYLCYMPPKLFL